ncbi:MAG: hypothetical protein KA715_06820 [Xanthomonadaceae bacterium]|nr:hypothetical protein [Xanthomonadaceae bacterium]
MSKKRNKPEINVELIPLYIAHEEFLEKRAEIQRLITKILIDDHYREEEEKAGVRLPPPSDPFEVDNG